VSVPLARGGAAQLSGDPLAGRTKKLRTIDWTAELAGPTEILELLRDALGRGPTRVECAADSFVLKLDHLATTADPDAVEQEAANAVRAALGAVHVFVNIVGEVTVTRVWGLDQRGLSLGVGPFVRVNIRVTSAEGKKRLVAPVSASSTVASRIVQLAALQPRVARALAIVGGRDPSWADIYLLMEIVEVDLRTRFPAEGKDWVAIKEKKWIRPSEVNVLKRNAAFHRHAKRVKTPSPAMPLFRAQVLSKTIMRSWLEELSAGTLGGN
jgi:hypothetical protein